MTPLIEHYQARDFIIPIDTEELRPSNKTNQFEEYGSNLKEFIIDYKAKIIFIDQLPLFYGTDWNQESGVLFISLLQRLARELNVLIIVHL